MKTIEEKARAYDEAIEAARCIYNNMKEGSNFSGMEDLEVIFPELQESEDERIKNLIYCLIRDRSDNGKLLEHNGVSVEEALAWLERQKPSDAALEYLKENHSPSEVSDFQAAMNIAVAKAYDRGIADAIKQDPCRTCDHPTMSCINFPCEKKKQAEQKPTEWSEEDERILLRLIAHFDWHGGTRFTKEDCQEAINWLKSLRPNHWKPSEEQMLALGGVLDYLDESDNEDADIVRKLINDLKKL